MWLELVLLATQRDGVGAPADELRDRAAALCKAGTKGACDLPSWSSPFDQAKAVAALTPHCEAGDGVSCLVVAWDLEDGDPGRALALLKEHCAAGLQRACTEVGYALWHGTGTYVQRPAASQTFRTACDQAEPTACFELGVRSDEPDRTRLLERAVDLGSALAHGALADGAPDEIRIPHLAAACDRGLGQACRELAPLEPDPLSRLEQSCRAQDDPSCVLALVGSAEWGGRAVADVATDLAALCPRVPEACVRRDLLVLGAPPVTFPSGSWPTRKDFDRLAADLVPVLFPCYVDRLARSPISGWIDVTAWIDPRGKIVAASARGPMADPTFVACANAASAGVRTRVPDGGAMIAHVDVGLDHTARTSFRGPPGLDAPEDYTALGKALAKLGPSFDNCATRAGQELASLELDVILPRTGTFKSVEIAKSTESGEVDLCARDLLRKTEMPLVQGRLKGRVTIQFLEPVPPPPIRPPVPLPILTAPPAGETLAWRVLAIVVRDNEIDGKTAAIGPHSLASIREAHAGVETYVREHTRGLVRMTTDVVEVDGPLTGAYERDEEGNGRWVMEPEDLTTELRRAVRPGHYHSLYVWVPIPTGFPLPYYGATFGGATVGGATLSSAPVPDRAEVVVNPGLPRWYPALVGLYSQLEVRSARQLGTRLPDNEEIVRLPDGRVFDPRDWLSEDEALDWYNWAFAERLTPELWHDLLTFGEATNVHREGNLAGTAEAVGPLTDPWLVNDGCVDLGRFPSAAVATTSGDVSAALFWEQSVEVGRVTVDLSAEHGATQASVAAIALDVLDAEGVFHEVERRTALDAARVEIVVGPRTTTGLRVRVLEHRQGVQPAFREIEVYAP